MLTKHAHKVFCRHLLLFLLLLLLFLLLIILLFLLFLLFLLGIKHGDGLWDQKLARWWDQGLISELTFSLSTIMPYGGAHPPHQKYVLFPFVLWGQKCCNVTAAQIQFWISLSTRIPSYPNTMRIAINWATLDNLPQQKKVSQHIYLHIYHSTYYLCGFDF